MMGEIVQQERRLRIADRRAENCRAPVGWQTPLVELGVSLAKRKLLVVGLLLIGAAVSYLGVAFTPDVFTARSVAMVLNRERPMLDARITARTLFFAEERQGEGGELLLPSQPEMYATLLQSPPVTLAVMQSLALTDISEAAQSDFQQGLQVDTNPDGLLTVSYEDKDPKFAAQAANTYVQECVESSRLIERGMIEKQASFLADAVGVANGQLQTAEADLTQLSTTRPLLNAQLEAEQTHRIDRELRQRLAAKQIELQTHLTTHTHREPTSKRLESEIEQITKQIAALDRSDGAARYGYEDLSVSRLEFERLNREVEAKRDISNVLSVQEAVYSMRAKAPPANIAILYEATVPQRPSGPARRKELLIGLAASIVLTCIIAVLLEQWQRARRHPFIQSRIEELRSTFQVRLRRSSTAE